MKGIILFITAFVLISFDAFSQQITNGYNASNPYTYFYHRENNESEIIFYFYEYKGEQIDLQHFKVFHPQLKDVLPNQIEVIPPSIFDAYTNKVYAVAYLEKCENCGEGALVVLLVADYLSSRPIYFIDYNMDGNYQNDGFPFSFVNNKKSQKIKIETTDEKKYVFGLYNTNKHKELNYKELVSEARKERDKMKKELATDEKNGQKNNKVNHNGFELGLDVFAGSGNLKYNYINLSTNYPTNYEVSFDAKGVSMNMGYAFKNVQLSLIGSYEGTYYWTSYKKTKLSEPEYINGNLVPFVSTITSGDQHPKSRLSYGFSLAYNIRMGKWVAIAPFVNYSWYSYPSNNFYIPNKRQDSTPYVLENRNWRAFGTSIKVNVNEHSEIYVKGMYILPNFSPSGYFDNLDISDLDVNYSQLNFGCGYRYHF